MASRTGAERLLAKSMSTASVRVSLALAAAIAAIVVAGCGGGSSGPQTASASSTSSSTTASTDPSPTASSEGGEAGGPPSAGPAGSNGDRVGRGKKSASGGAEGSNGAGRASSGKHGPRIAQPEGEPEPKITPQQRREATVVTMSLESPDAVTGGGSLKQLPAKYTCDGANTWPTLRWNGTPAGTSELALFVMNVQPVEGRLFFDWAVTGVDPGLGEVETEKLPKGTVVGRNSFGKKGLFGLPFRRWRSLHVCPLRDAGKGPRKQGIRSQRNAREGTRSIGERRSYGPVIRAPMITFISKIKLETGVG